MLQEGPLKAAIVAAFGSLDALKKEFNATTAAIQGSGWGWLVRLIELGVCGSIAQLSVGLQPQEQDDRDCDDGQSGPAPVARPHHRRRYLGTCVLPSVSQRQGRGERFPGRRLGMPVSFFVTACFLRLLVPQRHLERHQL